MNLFPIVTRELSVASRRPSTYWLRFWFSLVTLAVLLFILINSGNSPMAEKGQLLLVAVSIVILIYSLFSGVMLTADSIAEERREGTLGLLFLTNLKAYNVVLGKMAAYSLNSIFGLLSVFPILGLTLLLGGVTGAEFFRLVLVFLVTLFFSMSIGIFISSVVVDSRQAIINGLMLLAIFTGGFPLVWWMIEGLAGGNRANFLLWSSPVFAFIKAFQSEYGYGVGRTEFWESITILLLLGFAGLVIASLLLARSWRELGESPSEGSFWKRRRGKTKPSRIIPFKGTMWREKPLLWLAARDISLQKASWFIGALFIILIVNTLLIEIEDPFLLNLMKPRLDFYFLFPISVYLSYGLHFIGKVLVASEASRRMNADRRAGAWELLLVTPVKVKNILAGQFHALRKGLSQILTLMALANLLLFIQFSFFYHTNSEDRLVMPLIFIGGWIALWIDFHSLSWVGMWRGLKCVKQHNAILLTLLQIVAPGWLCIFLLIFMESRVTSIIPWVVGWFFITSMISAISGIHAKKQIQEKFRWAVLQTSRS